MSPEIQIDVSGMSFEWSELMGLDGFKEVLMGWRDTFDEYHVEPREFIDIGPNTVIVVVNDVGTVKGSGHELHNEFAHLWMFRDDLAVRWELFTEKSHALAAVGASE